MCNTYKGKIVSLLWWVVESDWFRWRNIQSRMGLRVWISHTFIVELVSEQPPGFPGGASGKEPACHCRRCQRDVGSRTCPGGSDGRESACNVGDLGSTPESGRSLGEGNGTPLQYSCLEHPMDRGAWWATVHRVAQSQTRLTQLSMARQWEVRGLGQGRAAGRYLDRTRTGVFWLHLCHFFHPLPCLFSGEEFPETVLILWFLLCMFSMK